MKSPNVIDVFTYNGDVIIRTSYESSSGRSASCASATETARETFDKDQAEGKGYCPDKFIRILPGNKMKFFDEFDLQDYELVQSTAI